MKKRIKILLILSVMMSCVSFRTSVSFGSTEFKVPPLKQPVTDLAHILDQRSINQLNQGLSLLRRDGGSQIAILTLPTIKDLTIEQASIQVVDQWQLGSREKDDGVLILVVVDQRKIRIEVGQGLEGDLPDAIAKRIIDESMVPLFREGQIQDGIYVGVFQVAKYANPSLDIGRYFGRQISRSLPPNRGPRSPSVVEFIIFSVFLIIMLSTRTGRAILFFFLLSGMRGGGRRGSGGFGGGGGGFSGGGASGKW